MGFLDIHNVTKSYGQVEVLHRIDIGVVEGEFLVLVGPSGCGKYILPVRVVLADGAPHASVQDADGQPLLLRCSQANLAAWQGRDILLGIRPEAITDPEGADRASRNLQPLKNRVAVTEPAGSDTFVTMTLGGGDVIARMRAHASVAPRLVHDFAVNMDKAVAFDPATEARIAP